MKKYIGKRIISFLIVLVGVSILSFLLIAWSGKDPAEIIAHRGVSNPTPEQIDMIRVEMGLDQPLPVRYIQWLSGMFTGELGASLTTHQPIVKDLHKYLATTTSLVGMAILWIIVLTVPISLLCARKRNRPFDQVTRGITICGICVPTFWLGFLLLLFFAIHLKWFSVLPSPGWRGFLLPSFALAVPSSCSLIRIMRSSLLAELSSDYVRFAKARGLSANRILVCHILRNALPPVVTIFFQQFGFLIAGGAVIESVFSIKGIGTYLVDSVIAADIQRLLDQLCDEVLLLQVILFQILFQSVEEFCGDFHRKGAFCLHIVSSFKVFCEDALHIFRQCTQLHLFFLCHDSCVKLCRDHGAEVLFALHRSAPFLDFVSKAYRKKSWKAIHQTQRRSYVKRKQNHQGSYTARRAAAIRPIMNSTQGIATLLPSALYRALSEASGISVQPSGKPCRRSHSNGVRRRMR